MVKETFCSHAWFSFREDDGKFRPCCVWRGDTGYTTANSTYRQFMDSEYMEQRRADLAKGIRIPECKLCWENEDRGINSVRTDANSKLIPDPKLIPLIAPHRPLLSADVKLGNLCNFACAMCNPADSTQIYRRWLDADNEFTQDYDYAEIKRIFTSDDPESLQQALEEPTLVNLDLVGGETLLYKRVLKRLADLPNSRKSKISLGLITNASENILHAIQQLGAFKNISVYVSLEGTGAAQDYIRKGSNWSTVEANILEFREQLQSNQYIEVDHMVQALSIEHYGDLATWCSHNDIPLWHMPLVDPDYLSIDILSRGFLKHADLNQYYDNYKYRPNLLEKFRRYIDWYERDHYIKLADVMPRLYNETHNR